MFRTLTQEAVNEQIRGFIAPVTHQLEELTRLVQGMTTSWHPNSYSRTELGTASGTAIPQSDTSQIPKKRCFSEKRLSFLKKHIFLKNEKRWKIDVKFEQNGLFFCRKFVVFLKKKFKFGRSCKTCCSRHKRVTFMKKSFLSETERQKRSRRQPGVLLFFSTPPVMVNLLSTWDLKNH